MQKPHQSDQPQNVHSVSILAITQAKVPQPNVQNGMMNVSVSAQARTFESLGKKYEIVSMMIATIISGMSLLYHKERKQVP